MIIVEFSANRPCVARRSAGFCAGVSRGIRRSKIALKSPLDFNGSYQHLIELSSIADKGAAKEHDEGTLGYPKDSFTLTVNYLNGPLSLFTNFNYTGPVNQGADEAANYRQDERLGSFLYINGGATIEVEKRFRFFMDIDNIFNAKPPYPVPAFGGAVTYFPGILGRYYRVGAGVTF